MNAQFLATFVAVLIPFCISVAAPNDASDGQLQTVVITATRIPTSEAQIASSVTLVTDLEIASRQIRTVPDLLKQAPGLNVVQSGGPGGQTSVFMRGTNSNHTKVLIDGIDVGDPSSANAAFDFGQLRSTRS